MVVCIKTFCILQIPDFIDTHYIFFFGGGSLEHYYNGLQISRFMTFTCIFFTYIKVLCLLHMHAQDVCYHMHSRPSCHQIAYNLQSFTEISDEQKKIYS